MTEFKRPKISFTPIPVATSDVNTSAKTSNDLQLGDASTAIANKLLDHLAQIQAYNNRIDAINYLIDTARSLAGNLTYTTTDAGIITAIQAIGGDSNFVDLALFEKSVDTVINGYKEMSMISLTGVANK